MQGVALVPRRYPGKTESRGVYRNTLSDEVCSATQQMSIFELSAEAIKKAAVSASPRPLGVLLCNLKTAVSSKQNKAQAGNQMISRKKYPICRRVIHTECLLGQDEKFNAQPII